MEFIKVLKAWSFGIVLGILCAVFFYGKSEAVVSGLQFISPISQNQNLLLSIFIKNLLASLTIIFLGPLLCMLELGVYRGVSSETYGFLERLTGPLYRMLSLFFPVFDGLRPFFRSCYFYLVFVPYFSMFVNGAVLGFLFGNYYRQGVAGNYLAGLFPHAIVEVPAMFASAVLALLILDGVKSRIVSGDAAGLENALKWEIKKVVLPAAMVQVALLFAAFLESSL